MIAPHQITLPHFGRFGGGTVDIVYTEKDVVVPFMHDSKSSSHWEDGTINFQQTMAVKFGIDYMHEVGMHNVALHTRSLIGWLAKEIRALEWETGQKFVNLYEVNDGLSVQGSSLSFFCHTSSGRLLPGSIIENLANKRGISVRTGCFCNPGTGWHLIRQEEDSALVDFRILQHHASSLHDPSSHFREMMEVKAGTGMVRVSVGFPTSFGDCYKFVKFLKECILSLRPEVIEEIVSSHVQKAKAEGGHH